MKKLLFLLLLPTFGIAQTTVTVGNAATDADSLGSQAPAYYLSRTNHTGAQLTTTITGFQDSVTANTNVTANTVHITSDGSAHADVATNTTHISSNGSDHTFIDQNVTTTSSPTFVLTTLDTIIQNTQITIGGCFTVADDATIVLPDASTQSLIVYVDGDNEWALAAIQADGTVTLVASVGSTVNTDTDTNLCIFDSGTGATIRNRLGSEKTVCYESKYKQ